MCNHGDGEGSIDAIGDTENHLYERGVTSGVEGLRFAGPGKKYIAADTWGKAPNIWWHGGMKESHHTWGKAPNIWWHGGMKESHYRNSVTNKICIFMPMPEAFIYYSWFSTFPSWAPSFIRCGPPEHGTRFKTRLPQNTCSTLGHFRTYI